jgi:hypothetical protein
MDTVQLAHDHFAAMVTGDAGLAARCIHPEHVNLMAADEPPACSLPGVPGFLATSAWLRLAFAELRFELIEMTSDAERSIAHVWMRGRQTGPFVVYPPGRMPLAFPPTGRQFAVRQCHVFRHRDGLHAEHIAVRDDLGMMTQLGHLPPSPTAMLRMARWQLTGAGARAVAGATAIARQGAGTAPAAASRPAPDPLADATRRVSSA